MRILTTSFCLLLAITPALADMQGPLPPGKPSGVQPAINKSGEIYLLVLAGAAAAGLGLLMLGKSNGGISINAAAISTGP